MSKGSHFPFVHVHPQVRLLSVQLALGYQMHAPTLKESAAILPKAALVHLFSEI